MIDAGDAQRMYQGTIVQYDGKLLHVVEAGGETLSCLDLTNNAMPLTIPTDPDLVNAPTKYRLGYLNTNRGAVFLHRVPMRQYQVGWSHHNVSGFHPEYIRDRYLDNFLEMCTGNYRSVDEAVALMNREEISVAIDNQFSLTRSLLKFCGRSVGTFSRSTRTVMLGEGHTHLATSVNLIKGLTCQQ